MKIIVVTGASRGIGREIAKILAEDGNIVIANYNKSENEANSLKDELASKNIELQLYKADVSNHAEVCQMIDFVINRFGKIDVLINNAGIDDEKMFVDITDDDWENMMKTNLASVFYCSKEAVNYMLKQQDGVIINISSVYATNGGACDVHYSTAKAGIIGMTKSLAKEMGLSNIRVNAIAPGAILTDMTSNLSENDWEEVKKEIPLNKIGRTIDIARCVEWLIKDEYTTGQVIEINGGWHV